MNSDPAALFDQAMAFRNSGRPAQALAILDTLLRAHPRMAALHGERGRILMDLARHDAALQSFESALAVESGNAVFLDLAGVCLQLLGRREAALARYDAAIARDPALTAAHYDRGTVLGEMDRLDEALASYDRALALQPDHGQALANKAKVLDDLARPALALACHQRALALFPDMAQIQFNTALCHLMLGQFGEGWLLYEARLRERVTVPEFARPLWRGEDLTGKSLTIHAEQGLGDVIQFCRYAALAAERGAAVILSVPSGLVRLLAGLHPGVRAVADDAPPLASDFHIMLMSLPLAFGTRLETIPAATPYLRAEPERAARWAGRIGGEGFRVGIAWQGDPKSASDPGRSISLTHFAGLAAIPGVRLISLQKGDGVEQLRALPPGTGIETLGDDFDAGHSNSGHSNSGSGAFVDTAAAMQALDLIITSDTAIAHLAGALGRPVWVALKHAPDWRWLRERDDCPWYPTMRLFRQAKRGAWSPVFEEIEVSLRRAMEEAAR